MRWLLDPDRDKIKFKAPLSFIAAARDGIGMAVLQDRGKALKPGVIEVKGIDVNRL
jgi:hypothetical protein